PAAPRTARVPFPARKAPNSIRGTAAELLGVESLYAVDRLHVDVETTIDAALQDETIRLFQHLADPEFVSANGLVGEHLLETGDPRTVGYGLLLFERTPRGNALRVQADNLDRPFDPNVGMKLELGSTAKLRTLAHYLEVMAALHDELAPRSPSEIGALRDAARDPLSRFASETLLAEPGLPLETFLDRALDRRYRASPYETFFTGGGLHRFQNFDEAEDDLRPTLRSALRSSTNLVFIRLMRDLVRYHEARLPYDAWRALHVANDPTRLTILREAAEREGRRDLERATRMLRGASEPEIYERLLGANADDVGAWALLFFAWNPDADEDALYRWLRGRFPGEATEADVRALTDRYGAHQLDLDDAAYSLRQSPLDLWLAGEMLRQPDRSFDDLLRESGAVRTISSSWLFRTRSRAAQNLRIRARLEADAFARMTRDWQRLGFPFSRLVPSYATALGTSSDRPAALAELMGIILNDGIRRSRSTVSSLTIARGTPYETAFAEETPPGERVMNASVARVLRRALAEVVEAGTARRLFGRFLGADGRPISIGGKTGSGDNRYKVFGRGGWLKSSRPVNRTAAFVFYLGDRYFGVLTAFVEGEQAGNYRFTSKLPVAILDLLAPTFNARFASEEQMRAEAPATTVETIARSSS
ncbi:MAG: glycosyl transferase family 51, partial [Candidatus Binatia bacterium]